MEKFTSGSNGRIIILRLDKGDMLLESIEKLIEEEHINNAVILSGIGSLDEVNIQIPADTEYPPKLITKAFTGEPYEIASIDGLIVSGKPHIHMVLGGKDTVLAGHTAHLCRILYLAEVVIQEVEGLNIERRPNEKGSMMIQIKV